ncbi:MAG: hypothetical protein QNJ47_12020 [Nostocaceae cyanobacterium]|nr:hypothetical protein [Nostocaceae cyanobacterium]
MIINLNHQNIFDYLIDSNVCKKEEREYIIPNFRYSSNFNWLIEIPENNSKLFVKQIPHYSHLEHNNRINQEWQIYNYLNLNQSLRYTSSLIPDVLHFDKNNSIVIYKLSNDYITLQSYYDNLNAFPNAIAELVGTTLAKLHSETMNSQECCTFMAELSQNKLQYQLPYPDYLSDYLFTYLEPESLKKTPVQSWRFFGILQQSESVTKVIKELVLHHQHCCLTHNNIQFKNIFIPRNWKPDELLPGNEKSDITLIKLINWEACSWGDPACDLGKAITGYFLFWINSMIIHHTIEIKKSIQLATIPLEIVRPSIGTMMKAYISIYPDVLNIYPEFIKRVVQFAGLGLIYQLLAEFKLQPETALSHQEIYFYIARQLLCRPEKFLSI